MHVVQIRLTRVGRVLLALLALTLLFLLYQANGAYADDQVVTDGSLRVVQTLNVVVAVLLPILVGLVTKATTSPGAKAWLLAALTVVGAFITTYVNDTADFDWFGAVLTAVVSFVTSVAAYYGLWRPTGVAAKAQASLVK